MGKSNKTILFLFCLLLLAGCVQQKIIDEVMLVEGIGFDYDKEKQKIVGTVHIPFFVKEEKVENKIHTATSDTEKGILQEIQRELPGDVLVGSIEILLFSKILAEEQGILQLLDPFQRDPFVGSAFPIAIIDGKPEMAFKGELGVRGNAYYLSKLIETAIKEGNLPKTNFQRFLADFYMEGKNTYLPILKSVTEKVVEIKGIAFLKDSKMVDEINIRDAFYFKLLVENFRNGFKEIPFKDDIVAVQNIYSKVKLKLVDRDPYKIQVHIKVKGIINEHTGVRILHREFKEIEKKIEKEIVTECEKLIKQFQEKNIDPIGFAHFIKTKTRNFDSRKWAEEHYKDLIVEVVAKVKLDEVGVIE